MQIKDLFKILVDKQGSDLFLRVNSVPRARINGVVKSIGEEKFTEAQMREITEEILGRDDRKEAFKQTLDIEFSHFEENIGRFRVNVFMQRGTPSIVTRYIKSEIQTFEELGLPDELLNTFCRESKGLVLLCGPAGTGKSTTISSMIDNINANQEKHIVTIEDPIEFLFKDKKSIINQRELGTDVLSYPLALKHVTQQSPDIIYIGTTRDVETMNAAITATELGAFVLTTLHTVNAVQSLTRVINFFPPYLHDEIRMQLSILLKGIVSLRLIPRIDKFGRIPAYETMVVTPTIARLIREGKINEIQTYINEGELYGMQSFKHSLVDLVKRDIIYVEDARRFADSEDEFNLELKGIGRLLE